MPREGAENVIGIVITVTLAAKWNRNANASTTDMHTQSHVATTTIQIFQKNWPSSIREKSVDGGTKESESE